MNREEDSADNLGSLNVISGVIKAEDEMRMNRMVFRMSRGRAIPSFYNIEKVDFFFYKGK